MAQRSRCGTGVMNPRDLAQNRLAGAVVAVFSGITQPPIDQFPRCPGVLRPSDRPCITGRTDSFTLRYGMSNPMFPCCSPIAAA